MGPGGIATPPRNPQGHRPPPLARRPRVPVSWVHAERNGAHMWAVLEPDPAGAAVLRGDGLTAAAGYSGALTPGPLASPRAAIIPQ